LLLALAQQFKYKPEMVENEDGTLNQFNYNEYVRKMEERLKLTIQRKEDKNSINSDSWLISNDTRSTWFFETRMAIKV
jgi:hypothetical protein